LPTAERFLLRGFTSQGTDRLLWHMTAIEAILGEKNVKDLTSVLANRLSRILTNDPKQEQIVKRAFKKCYDTRSRLVHGNARGKQRTADTTAKINAASFARKTTLWALHLAAYIAPEFSSGGNIPSRSDFLQ